MKFLLSFLAAAMLFSSSLFAQSTQTPLPMDRATQATVTIYCHNPKMFQKIFVEPNNLRILIAKIAGPGTVHSLWINDHGSSLMVVLTARSACVYGAIRHGTVAKEGRTILDKGPIKPKAPEVEA